MSETKVLHVTLPAELVRLVEAKVASGEYENESAVVASGLEALAFDEDASPHGEAEIECWLREEVVPTMDAVRDGRERLLSAEEAGHRIKAYIERRSREADDLR
ncbi:type II toxin-antitoxin system ParD family antitoxin [Aureimonas leprariae]|uniref:type II toxin-antitoxin system ParD family antitoxin n=1 Tax=Plantimonas leprariae TaxID=2615207 RepID=UPI00192A421B|nr:type II toxin-antitoxin system ParD family antitoxin [Aureimonas leprariae]